MAYDFPNAPLNGDIFTPVESGPSWQWNGTAWVALFTGAPGEAPMDGLVYGRRNAEWEEAIPAASSDYYLDRTHHTNVQAIDTVTGLQAALDTLTTTKAPLASPIFTGNPQAPTPAPGDNDTSVATTGYTTAAIAAAVAGGGGFPEAPTDGKSYSRQSAAWHDLTPDFAIKAPLADPVFTGNPQAPTPSPADADTSIATTAFVTAAIPRPTADARNRIFNGGMQVSQDNPPDTSYGSGNYIFDGWAFAISGTTGSPVAIARMTGDPLSGSYLRINSMNTVDASVAAGDVVYVSQKIEGYDFADLLWGTAAAKPVVVRFTARCVTAASLVVALAVRTVTGSRSLVKNITLTQTWQDFVVPVPGCTDGLWAIDHNFAVLVSFVVMAGSTYVAASESTWLTTNSLAGPGIGNIMAGVQNCFDVKNVGVHADPGNTGLAPRWEMPDYQATLAKAMRYWQQCYSGEVFGGVNSGTSYFIWTGLPVPPRPDCLLSGTNAVASSFPTTVGTFAMQGQNSVSENRNANGTSTFGRYGSLITVNGR